MWAALALLAPAAGGPARPPRAPRPASARCVLNMPPDGLLPFDEQGGGPSMALAFLRPLQHIYAAEADLRRQERQSEGDRAELPELRRLLLAAGFRPLTGRDVEVARALNAGCFFRLSLTAQLDDVDAELAAEFEAGAAQTDERLFGGRVLLWCRGYGAETSSGRLILPKLDYWQAAIVQNAAAALAKAIERGRARGGAAAEGAVSVARARRAAAARRLGNSLDRARAAVGLGLAPSGSGGGAQAGASAEASAARDGGLSAELGTREESGAGRRRLPLARYGAWLAAASSEQQLAPFLAPTMPATPPATAGAALPTAAAMHTGLGRHVPRVSMAEILAVRPERARLDGDAPGRAPRLRLRLPGHALLGSLFSRSLLSEPTHRELVALWRPLPARRRHATGARAGRRRWPRVVKVARLLYTVADHFGWAALQPLPEQAGQPLPEQAGQAAQAVQAAQAEAEAQAAQAAPRPRASPAPRRRRILGANSPRAGAPAAPACELRIFNDVPMANFAAVLPGSRLAFGPADALRLDLVTVASLLALLGGRRLSLAPSGRALLLALWLLRTLLNYRNALVRYDLVMNRFLTLRLAARGVGVARYLRGEAASQSALRASILLARLLAAAEGAGAPRGASTLAALRDDRAAMVRSAIGCAHAVRFDTDATARELERLGLCRIGAGGEVRLAPEAEIPRLLRAHWQQLLGLETGGGGGGGSEAGAAAEAEADGPPPGAGAGVGPGLRRTPSPPEPQAGPSPGALESRRQHAQPATAPDASGAGAFGTGIAPLPTPQPPTGRRAGMQDSTRET